MNLLIVESPAKAKTIEKYLGKEYKVLSSFGHVRDLPHSVLGVDLEKNYQPKYQILPKARVNIRKLKDTGKGAETIFLATDYDREGEAIAWHLTAALKLKDAKRITFYEITKSAIKNALKKPREIDMNLVDAQQARRVLDRLVGYKLSPFLWATVARGLSAGRVQSVAVRLVVEREEEIRKFKPIKYFILSVDLKKKETQESESFKAFLKEINHKKIGKFGLKTKEEAAEIEKKLSHEDYVVSEIEKIEKKINPYPPYMTSTFQRDAASRLSYSPKKTMFLAQKLYEAGHITYMRTDSLNIAVSARKKAREKITQDFGEKYLSKEEKIYKAQGKNAQEAHEAIRPTHLDFSPPLAIKKLEAGQAKLYGLIYNRFLASQMSEATFDETKATVAAGDYSFEAAGKVRKFDGFSKVYPVFFKEETLPELTKTEILDLLKINSEAKETKPRSRYTEASLIKELEKRGIGRPSTYAPTISTIETRGYVIKEDRYLLPTETGEHVNRVLVEHFPEIVDYSFTSRMEDDLDKIAEGKAAWVKVIDEFWQPFSRHLEGKIKSVKKEDISHEKTGKTCQACGGDLIIKYGRYGRFIACTGYPKCRYVEKIAGSKTEMPENAETKKERVAAELLLKGNPKCEKCGKEMLVRKGRFGFFLGCSDYPNCKNLIPVEKKIDMVCPECKKGEVIERRTRKGKKFWGCNHYPDCKWASWVKPKA